MGIVPVPLDADQTAELVELLKSPPTGEESLLLDLISNRVPAGVDQAAYVKAGFLTAIMRGETTSPLIDPVKAVELLGLMHGGYNITALIEALDNEELAEGAAKALSQTLLMFDAFYDVKEKSDAGNAPRLREMRS